MKTKIITLMLIIVTLFIFVGCDSIQYEEDTLGENSRFEYLDYREEIIKNDISVLYFRDTITDVVYIYFYDAGGNATTSGFTPLIDADGKPILWSEIKNAKETTK